jgi:ubiquinone/menaquinone biosynthesis C-methylase UbiE
VTRSGYSAAYYIARHSDFGFRFELDSMLRLLALRPGSRVLEIGCGGGALLAGVQKRGKHPFGLDINAAALELARQVAPTAQLSMGSASALPYDNCSFQGILAQHVIEHFDSPRALLQEWARVLAPGGTIVLITPNAGYPDHACFFDPTHQHIFSRAELEHYLDSTGFELQQSGTFRPLLRLPFRYRLTSIFANVLRRIPWFRETGAVIIVSATKRAEAA